MVSSPGFQSGNVGFESRFARSGLSIARPEPTRNNPLGSLINAVCPGCEGAVLKTIGLSGRAGSNPVCGAYRWMSRIGNAADCKSVASALGVQVSLRSVRVKHSLTRVD